MPHISENEVEKLITERDAAEEAMSQAYYLVTGNSPEWSNLFGYNEALEDIADGVSGLKQLVKRAQSAPVDLERVREASKRSSYAWSCDGEYTSQDWMNEGAIKLALSLLPPKESK